MQITTQETVKEMTRVMTDDYSRKILQSAISEAKSVEDLSSENGIPLSTCYRRVREMVGCGILVIERIIITPEGKKYDLYRSGFKGVSIRMENDGIKMDATINEDVADKLHSRWAALKWNGD